MEEVRWSPENSLALVKLLERNPCLWDRNNDGYKKKIARYSAIKNIAEELSIPYPQIDMKIKSVIGQYQRELKKEGIIRTGSGERYKSKWFLFNSLKFLPSMANGRSAKSMSLPVKDLIVEVLNEGDCASNLGESENEQCGSNDPMYDSKKSEKNRWQSRDFTLLTRRSYERRRAEDDAILRAVSSIAQTLSEQKSQDEWDLFGILVAKKIRSLKTRVGKIRAENEINNILFKLQANDEGIEYTEVTTNDETVQM